MRPLAIGSLFSGIGGLDLSVEAHFASLGFDARTVFQVEHDPFCNTILARHFPGAARLVRDVRAANAANLAPIDALCAGFPCQPVSLAGLRKAREDARWLWPECARIIGELRPRYVFLENVPGLLTADDGRAFGDVLGSLAALGYDAEWGCFRASDVGAPHRRERWFIVAWLDDAEHTGLVASEVGRVDGEGGCGEAGAHVAAQPSGSSRSGDGRACVADAGASGRGTPERYVRSREPDAARSGELADAHDGQPNESEGADRTDDERTLSRRAVLRARGCGPRDGDELAYASRVTEREPADEAHAVADRGHARTLARGDGESPAGDAIGAAQFVVGRDSHGLPDRLDASRWPAGRGEPQHAWEPPRTAAKVPHRPARLKALGNAVVWQQAALAWRVLWQRMEAAGCQSGADS